MIKTSVIIPVYNTSLYLEECINSVFNQTQKEVEVIVIDDGSTDDSWDVLCHLQKKHPELIVITQENRGQGYARNVGIERARGEYIYFLDSDDYILEDTLESCYECASKNNLNITLFDAFMFEDSVEKFPIKPNNCDRRDIIRERDEVFTGIYFLEKYYQKSYIPMDCLVYCSASFIKKNEIKFLSGVYFEDNEFYCKIMLLAERVMYIPKMFYQYRCRKNSTTGSKFDLRKARDHIEVLCAITGLKSLKGGKGWHVVKKICLSLLLYVANVCNDNNLYDKDSKLSERILDTWVKICGNTIENTDSLEDIENIYSICKYFADSDLEEIKKIINDKRNQLLIQTFEKLTLNKKGSRIAIYGCGIYTDGWLDFYEKWLGTIEADVFFLDSYVKGNNVRYRGYPVVPASEIKKKEVDYVFISSPQYEEEMKSTVQQLCGDKFVIVMLYSDLHINI